MLFTSGIDSYIAREYLLREGHDLDCLYFNHGGRYCKQEMEKLESLPFEVIIDDRLMLADLEEDDAHIPNRNILFTTLALSLGYKKVWLGGSLSDRVGDNKSEVYQRYSELLSTVNEEYCRIDSPFYDCYKDDMVKWFVEHRPKSRSRLLRDTFSCFTPLDEDVSGLFYRNDVGITYTTKECLDCSACFRKCAVLFSGGIYVHFNNREIVEHYEEQFSNPTVETSRTIGTMNYIERWYEEEDAKKS